jgi:hypothetical protein
MYKKKDCTSCPDTSCPHNKKPNNKKWKKIIIIILLFLALIAIALIAIKCFSNYCQDQDMAGNGTEQNPYIIRTVEDLDNIRNKLSAYYELGCDIDASNTRFWDNGHGWTPIGDWGNCGFKNVLDGKGHKITGLYIKRDSGTQCFIKELSGGTLKNILFKDISLPVLLAIITFH